MNPVPDWLTHAALPKPGEVHLQFWGPASAKEHGSLSAGYVLLTNQRFLFVRTAGSRHTDLAVQFDLPLPELQRVATSAFGVDVLLKVNHLEFRAIAPANVNPGTLANEMRSAILEARDRRIEELGKAERTSATGSPPAVIHREVIREIVKVPCRYCGTLYDQVDAKCPTCGAPRKA